MLSTTLLRRFPRSVTTPNSGQSRPATPAWLKSTANWCAPAAQPPLDGMVVVTASPRAASAQREAFDRILGNHLLYCTVCDNNNGNCTVHNTTKLLGNGAPANSLQAQAIRSGLLQSFLPLRSRPVHSLRALRRGLPESAGQRNPQHPLGGPASARPVGWRCVHRRIKLRLLRPLRHGLPMQCADGKLHARRGRLFHCPAPDWRAKG